MAVTSKTHPNVGGEGTKSQKMATAVVSSSAGGQVVNFATAFTRFNGTATETVDLSGSTLRRLTLINNHATADVLVAFDQTGVDMRLPAAGAISRHLWDTNIQVELTDDAVASVPVYLEAVWDDGP